MLQNNFDLVKELTEAKQHIALSAEEKSIMRAHLQAAMQMPPEGAVMMTFPTDKPSPASTT